MSPDEPNLSRRVVRRLRSSALGDLRGLGLRLTSVEEAVAENRSLHGGLERVVAEIEAGVATFEQSRRAPSHAPPEVTGR